ncbi:MAG: PDZ domain-containing protein [Gammaproteobacteria bacterium]|nr:PDZ domain-containing protein [Gammaproteobacteria bacterium]
MKPIVLFSLIFALSALSSQSALATTNGASSNVNNLVINTPQQTESWLGVWIKNIPMALGNHLLSVLEKEQGVMITAVSPNSPADKAGIMVYDIIAKFNGQAIFSQQEFTRLIQSTKPETKVKLTIIRQGKLITQEVVLEARPEQNVMPNQFNRRLPHPFSNPGFQRHFSSPFMKEPFFHPDFHTNFRNQFENDMEQLKQQMNQLQQQFKQELNNYNNQQINTNEQTNHWFQFESMQVKSIGNDKHRAEIKYKDSEGNNKEFIFEGKFQEIQSQILSQEDMSEDKKQQLLQALNLNNIQ